MDRESPPSDGCWQVSVTFDDGFRDNLELGLPILAQHEIPMTWFVATDYVENPERLPWWTMLAEAANRIRGPWAVDLEGKTYAYDLQYRSETRRMRQELGELFREATPSQQEQLSETLRQRIDAEVELPPNGFARRDEIQEAAQSPWITLGGHTMSHPNLAKCTTSELEDEIGGNRKKLQAWSADPVNWFAYPFGRRAYWNEAVVQAVQAAGYRGAVTTIPGYVRQRTDRYRVPRLVVQPGWDLKTFQCRVLNAGLYRRAQRVRRSIRARIQA
ncbi:MAG: polysaccharide deacetylase family protein [Salinibacter sp.]